MKTTCRCAIALMLLVLAACGPGNNTEQAASPQRVLAQGAAVQGTAVQAAAPASVVFPGPRSQYTLEATAAGYSVRDNATGVAQDVASGVRLRFADTAVGLDLEGTAGQAFRLYQAAFNRLPDSVGLGFHIDSLDRGATLEQVSQSFIDSAEFVNAYGTVSNVDFVTLLYANVLKRAPDAEGLAFHVGYLDGTHPGGVVVSRAFVLAFFSESPENKNLVLPTIRNGIAFTPWGVPPPPPQLFPQVQAIIMQRCVPCHSATPTVPGFNPAPLGIRFDTEAEIRVRSAAIQRTAVQSQFMPFGNITGMTQAERDLLASWFAAGMP